MKAYGELEAQLQSFLTSVLDGVGGQFHISANFFLGEFTPELFELEAV
jgi:hypothetical protein